MPPMIVAMTIERGEVTARDHAKFVRDALRSASEFHLAEHMPQHFEQNSKTKPGGAYGYRDRSRQWQERKRRLTGGTAPNVLTGRMRAAIIGGAKITATQHKSTIRFRNYFAMTPARWAEMKAITPGEFRKLRQVAQSTYNELAAANRRQRKRKTI